MNIKNKKIIYSIIIFILIISLLGIPYTNWGFMGDDHGNIYNSIIKNYKDVLKFFTQGITGNIYIPSNGKSSPQNFLSGAYRPMSFVYYGLQYFLFQTKSYGYFLTTISIHAINTIFLFNLFSYFFPVLLSFLLSLLFAFNSSLWNWLGWISAQTYQVELLIILLTIFLLKKYIDTQNFFYYFISCLLFLSNLFLKEQIIFLPIWIIFALYFYLKTKTNTNFKKSLILSIGYWLTLTFYFLIRYIVLTSNQEKTNFNIYQKIISLLYKQKERFFDFVTYISDFFNLTPLPPNHPIIKGFIIIFICLILFIFFIKNSKKSLIIFLYFSTLIFSWPCLLIQYQPRYIYTAIPLFILTIGISIKYANFNFKNYYKLLNIFLTLLIIFQIIFLTKKFKLRENVFYIMNNSFKNLLQKKVIQKNIKNKKPLCFIALPRYWLEGDTAQAIWLFNKNNSYPIYIYNLEIREKGRTSYREIPKFNNINLKITPIKNGFICKSPDINKIWFLNKNEEKIEQMIIKISPKYILEGPLFISWNYEKAKFKILNIKAKELL